MEKRRKGSPHKTKSTYKGKIYAQLETIGGLSRNSEGGDYGVPVGQRGGFAHSWRCKGPLCQAKDFGVNFVPNIAGVQASRRDDLIGAGRAFPNRPCNKPWCFLVIKSVLLQPQNTLQSRAAFLYGRPRGRPELLIRRHVPATAAIQTQLP